MKACEGLAAQGDIKEKVYGKQKVYVADQSQFPEADDSEIKAMDGRIAQLTQELQLTMEEVKKLESGNKGVYKIYFSWFQIRDSVLTYFRVVKLQIESDQSNKQVVINPCPAEPEYTLPLQTV